MSGISTFGLGDTLMIAFLVKDNHDVNAIVLEAADGSHVTMARSTILASAIDPSASPTGAISADTTVTAAVGGADTGTQILEPS